MNKDIFDSGNTLYLVDGTAFVYRAFYAIKGLSSSKGLSTGAVFGFITTLRKIIKEFSPVYMAVCFDVSRRTFRNDKFKNYKANRPAAPDGFKKQMSLVREVLEALSVPVCEKEGYEADDIIATLSKKACMQNMVSVAVSSDKDILQLVKDGEVIVYDSNKNIFFDEKKVKDVIGVSPENIPDLFALSGDSVDNIPGVKGIGPKTAKSLIERFGGIDELFNDTDMIDSRRLRNILSSSKETAFLSRELALLDKNVPFDIALEDLKIGETDTGRACDLFKELGFKSLLKEFSAKNEALHSRQLESGYTKELLEDILKSKRIVFYISEEGNFISFRRKVYSFKTEDIKDVLMNPNIEKVSFDLKEQKAEASLKGVNIVAPYFDVMIAAFLLGRYSRADSFEDVLLEYMGVSLSDAGGRDKAYYLEELSDALRDKLREEKLSSVFYRIEMPLINTLFWMEESPISLNTSRLREILFSLRERKDILRKSILQYSNKEVNLDSPKQLSVLLFSELKLNPVKKTKTGFSTNEESLTKLVGAHPVVEKILEYRKLSKLISTYAGPFLESAEENKGIIFPKFSQVSSVTGRLVSFSPNLQNIPVRGKEGKEFKSVFIPSFKDGFILGSDYSQIELRILAHISKDSNLTAAFNSGKDVHISTASLLFAKEESEVTPSERSFAKRINFGIVYGMSPYGLSKELKISVSEAESFIESYFLRYKKVKEYIDGTQEFVKKHKFVETIFGRRRYLGNISSPNKSLREYAFRQAVNAPIQGTAADIIKIAMVSIHDKFKGLNLSSRLIIQVHDELVFDVERDELGKVQEIVKEEMERAVELSVPLKVNIQSGRNWLEATK